MGKGIALCAGFLAAFAAGTLVIQRVRRCNEENGIETDAVIPPSADEGTRTERNARVIVCYHTEDGTEIEDILSDPPADQRKGQ